VIDVASKAVTVVDTDKDGEIVQFAWSPDSRWIAYGRSEAEGADRIYLYSLDSKKAVPVTDTWYNSGGPAFSRDGKYLFFVSDRDFNPIYSST
ncbi:MAG: hypothetical protein ACXWH4_12855, partial [Candidatus Aminicenantales bacterium]